MYLCSQPWDDETDHAAMLVAVKSIEMDGLLWGASKLVPIGYGIKKLQVTMPLCRVWLFCEFCCSLACR